MTDKELIQALRKVHDAYFTPGVHSHSIYGVAADRLEALLAENERLKAKLPKWVSVEERLPETELETATADEPDDAITCEISVRVLVVDRTGKVRVARYELGPHFQGWQENGRAVGEVTHWMPLPEPPSTEEVE